MSPSTEIHDTRASAWELKFLITPALAEQIRGWARAHLVPDPNAQGAHGDTYRITSLYFDTAAPDLVNSLNRINGVQDASLQRRGFNED